ETRVADRIGEADEDEDLGLLGVFRSGRADVTGVGETAGLELGDGRLRALDTVGVVVVRDRADDVGLLAVVGGAARGAVGGGFIVGIRAGGPRARRIVAIG